MRKKRCQCCHELYEPEARSYRRQKTCTKPACRAMRKRQAVARWKYKNPVYSKTESQKYRQWCNKHPFYWCQWRRRHAGYVTWPACRPYMDLFCYLLRSVLLISGLNDRNAVRNLAYSLVAKNWYQPQWRSHFAMASRRAAASGVFR